MAILATASYPVCLSLTTFLALSEENVAGHSETTYRKVQETSKLFSGRGKTFQNLVESEMKNQAGCIIMQTLESGRQYKSGKKRHLYWKHEQF